MWLGILLWKTYKVIVRPKGEKKKYEFIIRARNLRGLAKKLRKRLGELEQYDIEVLERVG